MVAVNGVKLHYVERGSGEPLLLLHGFTMCGTGDWNFAADKLAKNHHLIIPDLRGHGRSTNPSGIFTMRQSSEDIRALLDHLGVKKVRAIGISAGAMTLLHLASKYPERVESMVLIGAANEFPEQARRLAGATEYETIPPEILGYMKACASRGDQQVRSLIGQMRGFARSYDDMNLTSSILGKIRARTLIIHGDRDEFFPVDVPVKLYKAIPNSQLWIVPNGDHVPIHGDRMAEFLRIAVAFIDAR